MYNLRELYKQVNTISKSYFKWQDNLETFIGTDEETAEGIRKLIKEKRDQLVHLNIQIGRMLTDEVLDE